MLVFDGVHDFVKDAVRAANVVVPQYVASGGAAGRVCRESGFVGFGLTLLYRLAFWSVNSW